MNTDIDPDVDVVARALYIIERFKGDPRSGLNCFYSEALAAEIYRLRRQIAETPTSCGVKAVGSGAKDSDTDYPRCRLEDCRRIIPETKRSHAIYCSTACSDTAARRRNHGKGKPSGINLRSRSRG